MTRAKRKSKPKPIAPAAEELQKLADLGITEAQLAGCRFSPRHTACPLDERAILLDPTIPEELWVKVFPRVRLPLIRRITQSNDPTDIAYCPAAWIEIGLAEMQPLFKEALNSRAGNRDKARLPRKKITFCL